MDSLGQNVPTIGIPANNILASFAAHQTSKPHIVDSGASEHFFVDRHQFITYEPLQNLSGQAAEAGSKFRILGRGKVYKKAERNGKITVLELSAYHTPDFAANLISVSRMTAKGCTVLFKDDTVVFISPTGTKFLAGSLSNGTYIVPMDSSPLAFFSRSRSLNHPAHLAVWHERLGHPGDDRILKMKDLVDGLDITSTVMDGKCVDCIHGKQSRRPFDEIVDHETEVLERIHLDLWGKARTRSVGGKEYMMLLTDGKSGCRDVYFLENKQSKTTLEAFKLYVTKVERQTGKKVRIVRIYGGGEFEGGV